jgi:hypothetical protein
MTADEQVIEAILQQLETAWNRYDSVAFAAARSKIPRSPRCQPQPKPQPVSQVSGGKLRPLPTNGSDHRWR